MKLRLSFFFFTIPFILLAQPPAGYYNAATGQTCAGLKTALKNIITAGHVQQSYGDLWTIYLSSDVKPREVGTGSANVIWDIYSDNPSGTDPYNFTPSTHQCGNYNSEADCYNREHSFPSSWFNDENPAISDFIHILPTDGYVNNARGNLRFGEVAVVNYTSQNGSKRGSSATAGITGTVFEPINEYKGDVARIYFYMVTRYQDRLSTWNSYATDGALTLDGTTFPSIDINYLKLMLKWHNQDPVSAKETARNNSAYSFQSNRNPFVDHPEYVAQVWNSACPGLGALPVDVILFTGTLNGHTVKLDWDVATEINLDRYEVERSFNGTDYSKIGSVKAENKNTYGYNDNVEQTRGRRIYYRLKKVDKDGKYSYSAVFTLHVPLNTKFIVYPNPASDVLKLQLNNNSSETATIIISDITGKIVLRQIAKSDQGIIRISTSNLGTGHYIIKMITSDAEYSQRAFIINK
jgi:endonuclease I